MESIPFTLQLVPTEGQVFTNHTDDDLWDDVGCL
ncbi:hypothetical protein EV207_108114 [Scopulibacillus darangshiensis]|uniref:Uncharacterized protein n=1 Tax=Scopulibacillus darangshiensis TaxID=442528 RepID=A0A4R2P4Y2_9BACL|nr:hypothetical protein EV207_108114 [Scopulibacillus darangshiensis]